MGQTDKKKLKTNWTVKNVIEKGSGNLNGKFLFVHNRKDHFRNISANNLYRAKISVCIFEKNYFRNKFKWE